MDNKVFAIIDGLDETFIAVVSTEEKAKALVKAGYGDDIVPCLIDTAFEYLSLGVSWHSVAIDKDGKVRGGDNNVIHLGIGSHEAYSAKVRVLYDKNEFLDFCTLAKDNNEAIALANAKRIQLINDDLWKVMD